MTTTDVVFKAKGYQNGLQVWSISSIDDAWFVPDRGLVLFGQVMPGKLRGVTLRVDERDDPSASDFVAMLTPKELHSMRPRLHANRLHRPQGGELECISRIAGAKSVAVERQQPSLWLRQVRENVSIWDLRLEDQRLYIQEIEGVTLRGTQVWLGPHTARPIWYVAYPLALVTDALRWAISPITGRLWPADLPHVSQPAADDPPCRQYTDPLLPAMEPS